MNSQWLKKHIGFYFKNDKENGHRLYALPLGGWEIGIIALVILIIFGVGKLGNVGGALGKSIREFRKEKDKVENEPKQLPTKESGEESSPAETRPEEETKD
jgi:sec-independent protein translocase protein TatA